MEWLQNNTQTRSAEQCKAMLTKCFKVQPKLMKNGFWSSAKTMLKNIAQQIIEYAKQTILESIPQIEFILGWHVRQGAKKGAI